MASISPANADDENRLLGDAAAGNAEALRDLFELHREKLRRMVALRMDSRLAARVDASDVVQEALMDAARKLGDYERDRPLPFYPWLHRLAAERLAAAHRQHHRESRSVGREQAGTLAWPDLSARLLVDRLIAHDPTPGHALVREERRQQLHAALGRLSPPDREVLVLRFLEDLTFPEIAAILGVGESAAKMRHLRALQRIRTLMEPDGSGSGS
jgi:RNA polymerase sigma-70 factor, ECF subfamily